MINDKLLFKCLGFFSQVKAHILNACKVKVKEGANKEVTFCASQYMCTTTNDALISFFLFKNLLLYMNLKCLHR